MAGQSGYCRSGYQRAAEEYEDIIYDEPVPWKLEFRSSKAFVTWVVAIAVFTDVFIYGMIIPILPEVLRTRVSVPEDQLQRWMSILLAAFGGTLFVGSPIFGYFADRSSSRQAPFLIGLLALAGSTIMFWFAQTISMLVIARAFQGLSCAVVWTVGMALIVDTMGKDQVGAAMGIVSMAMTVGTVSGPFVGGVMLSKAGYHAVFGLAIGMIVLDIVLRLVMIERKNAAKWIDIQSPPPEAAEESQSLLAPATQNGSYESFSREFDPETQSKLTEAEEILPQRKSSLPGIVRLMGSLTLWVVLDATLVEAMAWASFDSVLPLYVRSTFNMNPMGIGLCFIPLFLPSFLSTIIGNCVDRYGSRKIALLGFILDVPTFLLLQLVTQNTTRDKVTLYFLLFSAGLGAALKTVSLMVEINHVVEEKEKRNPGIFGDKGGTAQAYGLFNVAWSGGQVAGPLVSGWLVDAYGWAVMVSVFGVVSAVTAVVLAGTAKGVRIGLRG
ncbi:MFS transporter [Aspergillus stella-maris]|uniref:MFS transporter n=1 Tax=Aspergillus stella-maris TaxID=1810926 RepID=UPI003CCCD237